MVVRGENWSAQEVEATVADYMHMLTLEMAGQTYNKSLHRRALISKLNGRSAASVERKHQNISAVLRELGCHWISGYKPLPNYQGILFDAVSSWLNLHPDFDRLAISAAEQPAVSPLLLSYNDFVVDAPAYLPSAEEPRAKYSFLSSSHVKRDYVSREARNASLGLAGEELAISYERHRLLAAGKESLADKIEHVSRTQGDGAGFDVLSFETTGEERFIEVKTTAFGKQTPFFASINELEFARAYENQFHLYRFFEFRRNPKLFELSGRLERHCRLDPISFLCRF